MRVLLVDDHPMIRSIVRAECERAGIEVVADCGDGDSALMLTKELSPDVVVLDIQIPGLNGLEVARRLKTRASSSKIVILTGSEGSDTLFKSVRLDVDAFLDKKTSITEIGQVILSVARGEKQLTSEQRSMALKGLGDFVRGERQRASVSSALSERESSVLKYIAEGLTTRQISRRLELSDRTVESHIAKLYKKIGARNRAEALAEGRRLGFLDDPHP